MFTLCRSKLACIASVWIILSPFRLAEAAVSLDEADETVVIHRNIDAVNLQQANAHLDSSKPTVDVVAYLAQSTDTPHHFVGASEEFVKSFEKARTIFKPAGLQLKLAGFKAVTVPPEWLKLQANRITGKSVDESVNPYIGYRIARWKLTEKAERIFEKIIERQQFNNRTIYLIYLHQVKMAYFDRTDKASVQIKSIPTGGLSLPAYLFESRIPHRIRGVITLCKNKGSHGRTIAHELGHKLINVSHEYREITPQFEVRGEGGLMIYGRGVEIPGGEKGRWHRERLLLSPFIYRIENGKRIFNPDYQEAGHYYDPVYGDKVIRFGKMNPDEGKK